MHGHSFWIHAVKIPITLKFISPCQLHMTYTHLTWTYSWSHVNFRNSIDIRFLSRQYVCECIHRPMSGNSDLCICALYGYQQNYGKQRWKNILHILKIQPIHIQELSVNKKYMFNWNAWHIKSMQQNTNHSSSATICWRHAILYYLWYITYHWSIRYR